MAKRARKMEKKRRSKSNVISSFSLFSFPGSSHHFSPNKQQFCVLSVLVLWVHVLFELKVKPFLALFLVSFFSPLSELTKQSRDTCTSSLSLSSIFLKKKKKKSSTIVLIYLTFRIHFSSLPYLKSVFNFMFQSNVVCFQQDFLFSMSQFLLSFNRCHRDRGITATLFSFSLILLNCHFCSSWYCSRTQ